MSRSTLFITGASSGIGRATAKRFQAEGWNVIATMRSPDDEAELTSLTNVLVARLDVTDPGSIEASVAKGLETFGHIDVLVNNAGYGAYGPLESTPLDKIRRQYEVNVVGVYAVTKALLPHFREHRSGVIVNVSSVGGKVTFPLGSVYQGSKFAVEGLSESLAYEVEPIGVRVKIIEPGIIKTDFGGRSLDFSNDPAIPEYQGVVQALMRTMEPAAEQAVGPEVVAEVIYRAATDGTDRLRYTAGEDAAQVLAARKAADDETFFAATKRRFGL